MRHFFSFLFILLLFSVKCFASASDNLKLHLLQGEQGEQTCEGETIVVKFSNRLLIFTSKLPSDFNDDFNYMKIDKQYNWQVDKDLSIQFDLDKDSKIFVFEGQVNIYSVVPHCFVITPDSISSLLEYYSDKDLKELKKEMLLLLRAVEYVFNKRFEKVVVEVNKIEDFNAYANNVDNSCSIVINESVLEVRKEFRLFLLAHEFGHCIKRLFNEESNFNSEEDFADYVGGKLLCALLGKKGEIFIEKGLKFMCALNGCEGKEHSVLGVRLQNAKVGCWEANNE